jgi:hypothetical protein
LLPFHLYYLQFFTPKYHKQLKQEIMLEQLIGLVKQYAGEAIVNNPAIPNEKNEEAMAEASNTVVSGLQNVLAGGGLQSILNLFSGGGNSGGQGGSGVAGLMQNPIVNMMAGHLMKKLMGKFGLNSSAASSVATNIIPNVLNGLISKTQDPNDNSIDLNGIIRSLTGGNVQTADTGNSGGGGFDFQGLLKQFTGGGGGNNGGGGGFNLTDIISQVTRGAQQNQEQQAQQSGGGGGLMDMLKGLIGG